MTEISRFFSPPKADQEKNSTLTIVCFDNLEEVDEVAAELRGRRNTTEA
jgi:hypothetical protein